MKVVERLSNMSPFQSDNKSLMNIANGVVADESSDIDDFFSIGSAIVEKMIGKDVYDFSFKRKDAAKTMSIKTKIGKNNEIEIDPALLFQRLLVVAKTSTRSYVVIHLQFLNRLSCFERLIRQRFLMPL